MNMVKSYDILVIEEDGDEQLTNVKFMEEKEKLINGMMKAAREFITGRQFTDYWKKIFTQTFNIGITDENNIVRRADWLHYGVISLKYDFKRWGHFLILSFVDGKLEILFCLCFKPLFTVFDCGEGIKFSIENNLVLKPNNKEDDDEDEDEDEDDDDDDDNYEKNITKIFKKADDDEWDILWNEQMKTLMEEEEDEDDGAPAD